MIKVCRLFDLLKHISTTKLNKIVVFRHATKIFSVPVRHSLKFPKNSMMTKYEWVNKDQSADEEAEEAGGRRRDRAKELFMSADNTMVMVGGG